MPPFGPTGPRDLVRYFKQLGFDGPYSAGKHEFMVRVSGGCESDSSGG
jgi:hypothetical protein